MNTGILINIPDFVTFIERILGTQTNKHETESGDNFKLKINQPNGMKVRTLVKTKYIIVQLFFHYYWPLSYSLTDNLSYHLLEVL